MTANESPVLFALVGCGRISGKHLDAIQHIKGAELAAVCDIQVERARNTGEKYGVPWYTNYHEMAAKHPEVSAFSILTPSGLHARETLELAPYGKHIIVEKPMALTIQDAESMIRACDQAGVRLFVVKQNRYNLPVQQLKAAMDAGRFGKLVMGTVRVRWCREQSYYDMDSWRGTWSLDGGVISNQASHHIDLLTYLMGDVESVFSYTTTRLVQIEADDTAVAVLKFTNGALGVVEATTATRPKDLEGSISILGEGGSVEIAGFAVNEMRTWNFAKPLPEDAEVLQKYKENPPNVYGFGHQRYLQGVVDSIRKGKGGAVDGMEGLKSLTLINAMYESMETGAEVSLRFRGRRNKLGKELARI
jgi:UDP-N-acetyl-2-amino-2-deoxyglucuronate dehydrogenase